MAFSFWAYLFFFLEIITFLYYADEESDDVIGGFTKTVQHSIKNISKNIGAVFFKLGTGNVHHKRNKMTPFSSPEAALLLVSTKNRDLWPGPMTFWFWMALYTIDWERHQSDLSDLTLSMHRVTGSLGIVDFQCWTRPDVTILVADQMERGLWGRE